MPKRTRDIRTIIDDAGGPKRIAEASRETARTIIAKSVYDWPRLGIPERHWPMIIRLAKATADELLLANVKARSAGPLSDAA